MDEEESNAYFEEYRAPEPEEPEEEDDDEGEPMQFSKSPLLENLIHANADEDIPTEDDQYGRIAYLAKCEELGINPVSQVLRFLETEEMQVMHYGLGGKGTLALVAA